MDTTAPRSHTWRFFRTCGLDQALLTTGSDIEHLASLDQKLWTALSCPTRGLRLDAETLALLDTDNDGRIRVPELLGAIDWLAARLASFDSLLDGSDTVKLDAISTTTPEGKALLVNAKRILSNLGKGKSDAISLADVTDTAKIFAGTRFNGDGIVPAEAADDPAIQQTITDIITLFGAETDRSGKPGVNQAKTDAFFEAVAARLQWEAAAKADPAILPLGKKTAAAAAATAAVRVKIDDYFTRCRMAAFDPRAAQALSRTDADLAALADQELSDTLPAIAAFPLSKVEADRDLPLLSEANPYWADALAAFHATAVKPLLKKSVTALSAAQWQTIKTKLAPYDAWLAAETGKEVAALSADRLEACADDKVKAAITELIAKDLELEAENAQITEVERLIRYHANLMTLLNNYVNMGRLYDPNATAIFQVGTLYMDARAADLCFHVDSVDAHATLAAASKCCLAYCTLTRPATKETRTICAAFTAGFAQTLWVGRNGIFYDLDGKDWDATIVKIVDNAISLKEAFWEPWRKIAAMISAQINKLLASKQDAALAAASKQVDSASAATAAPASAAAPEAPKKMDGAALASSVAALGIAIGLIGSAVGGLVSVLAGLPLWKTLVGVAAVILIVSGPSMILTWFKLRARDLAPILNACGWAVNRRLRFSLKLGRLFTSEATLPENATRELKDPYADDTSTRNTVITLLVLAAIVGALWMAGVLDNAMPDCLKRKQPACADPATIEAPATPAAAPDAAPAAAPAATP